MNCSDFIFDLYGTLVDIHTEEDTPYLWRELAALYRHLGADWRPAQLRQQWKRLLAREEHAARSRYSGNFAPELCIDNVFARLFSMKGTAPTPEKIRLAARHFRRLSTVHIGLYDGAPELLSALHEQGKRVWLLSNAQRLFTACELEQLGLAERFDGICLSSDYGVKKPDPAFFRILLERQGILPGQAVMIGNDGTCDIAGGKGAGLSTVYIRSNISPQEPLPEADIVLTEMDLKKLRAILLDEC